MKIRFGAPRASFRDRADAGAYLAGFLEAYRGERPLVLGIPRGGVPVAAEVAARLDGELDVVVARKLGAPFHGELAIGAVTASGGLYLDRGIIEELGVSEAYLQEVIARESEEGRQRQARFRGSKPAPLIKGRTVIVVDDGLATGATMRAALRSVAVHHPKRLICAVPVGAPPSCEALRHEADEVVCPLMPDPFWAVGLFYEDFEPVDDREVTVLLRTAGALTAASA
jgi:predicted phosphoribosyltransferase